jgi:PAS domain S-box-containing protein
MMRLRYRALFASLSLISRIFLATAVALLVALIMMLQTSSSQDAVAARAALERQLFDDLSILPVTLSETIITGDYSTIKQILTRYVQRENLTLIRYQSVTGKEITAENFPEYASTPAWFASWMGLQDMQKETPVEMGGRHYGTLKVQLSAQKWTNQSWSRFKNSLAIMSFAVLLDFIGIWLVLKTGLASLEALHQGAIRLAAGELDTRLVPRGSPELRRSMESFNAMANAVALAQSQLSVEAERLHVTLASIADGVISTDEAGRVVFVNPVAEALTGWREKEVLGLGAKDVFKLIDESTREPSTLPLDRVLSGNTEQAKAVEGAALLIARDGREIPIADSAATIRHAGGRVSGAVLVFRDQTAARAKEAQLKELNAGLEGRVIRRTQDLQDANINLQLTIKSLNEAQSQLIQSEKMASLGSLVAGISHEINTPIGIGVTAASSIDEEVKKLSAEFKAGSMKRSTLESFIDHVSLASNILLGNLQRASELIRSFKQVAVDQSSDDNRTINLHDYLAEILSSLHPRFTGTSIRVENRCSADLEVYTKPGVIYQIVSNLVLNSLTHAYAAGQAGLISIAARREDANVVLDYQDDGNGIAEQDMKRVFDPFFTTKRGQGGSGLGLNIVYNLVSSTLNGKIEIASKLGQGTTFRIVFPMKLEGECVEQPAKKF